MTIDFSGRNWKLKRSLAFNRFTSRNPKLIGLPMNGRLLRVEAKFPKAKPTWKRVGTLHQVYRGSTPPNGHVIDFGQQFITMANLTPYTLLFRPVYWLPDGYLRIWEYIQLLTDRDLLELTLQQEQSSNLSTITQILTMSLTDISSFKASIAELARAAAATAAQTVSLGQTIVTIEASMVRQYTSQDILKAMFVQLTPGSAWTYDVVHGLNDAFASDEVYDVQKQKQLLQTSPIDANTVRLELSQDEYDSADFPFVCSVQGKAITNVVAGGQWEAIPGGTSDFRLMENMVQETNDGGISILKTYFSSAVDAFLDGNLSRVYAKVEQQIGGFKYWYNTVGGTLADVEVTQSVYDVARLDVSAVILTPGFMPI